MLDRFNGHIHKTILNNVLNDQYLTAMCVEDYISSMSKTELDQWIKTFINIGGVENGKRP